MTQAERDARMDALVQAMDDLSLTPAGLRFVWGWLAEFDPAEFGRAIEAVQREANRNGHPELYMDPATADRPPGRHRASKENS